jgi:hypothetical protein
MTKGVWDVVAGGGSREGQRRRWKGRRQGAEIRGVGRVLTRQYLVDVQIPPKLAGLPAAE